MGGALGNPIDEAAQQRINERIQNIIQTFAVEFSKAYTQAVIEKAKADLEPESSIEDELKLETAPVPSAICKEGTLTKQGGSVRNWKARHFVAYNAKDNFKIDYHDGTSSAGKLKGTIFPAGYYAYEFNSDETAEFGEFGIKLSPWSWRRRVWYIRCASEEERKEWLPIFQNACYKAKAPRDEDECIAIAFDNALRNTRWQNWIWGWYGAWGSEGERLGELILDVLDREIISDILSGIPENPAKSATVNLVRSTVGASVKAATSSAWLSSVNAVRSVSSSIQSSVKDLISPLVEKQKTFKETIVQKVSGTVNPFLATKGAEVLRPILNVIFKPVTDAFVLAVQGFHAHLASKITSNEFTADNFTSKLNYIDWQMDWWSGPLYRANQLVYRLYTSDLATVASYFTGGISPSSVYNLLLDKIKFIIHRAVFTFGNLAKSVGQGEQASVLSHVTTLLFHDSLLLVKSVIMEVLKLILDAPLQELVLTPAKALVAPIQETIDSIPIPGLPILFDLNSMLEEVVYDIEDSSIEALISGTVGDIKATFEVASTELGIASINLD